MSAILNGESRLLKYVNVLLSEKIEKFKQNIILNNNISRTHEEVECLLNRLYYEECFTSNSSNSHNISDETFLTYLIEDKKFANLYDISKLFDLQVMEIKILLLLTIFEIDDTYRKVFYYLTGDDSFRYPVLKVILYILFDSNKLQRENIFTLIENKIIQKYSLVEIVHTSNKDTVWISELRINPIVLHYILGTNILASDLKDYSNILKYEKAQQYNEDFLKRAKIIKNNISGTNSIIYFLHGIHGTGKKAYTIELAGYLKKNLMIIYTPILTAVFTSTTDLNHILAQFKVSIKSILLYAALNNHVIYFEKFESLFMHEHYHLLEKIFLDIIYDFNIILIAGSSHEWSPGIFDHNLIYIKQTFKKPDYKKSLKLWKEKLTPYGLDKASSNLANMFNFSKYEIEKIFSLFHNNIISGGDISIEELFEICRENIRVRLKGAAQALKLNYSMTDIILPYPQVQQLNDYINYWKNRHQVLDEWGFSKRTSGRGITALFTGPPGTGKTMAAGIIGKELNLQVYRIDLSQMISKYIGETEKNLQNIFDVAERGGVLLLFDEADSIFGKRTEITDSHDRFANIAVSYLLQKIENYDGPIILTTNFFNNIDEAFMRRIQFIVEFSCPDKDQSYKIWQAVFPEKAPVADNIDYDFLVEKFKFTGGNIRNIAIGSAFYAAEEHASSIVMGHIMLAVKEELKKTGRIFNPEDFDKYWLKN